MIDNCNKFINFDLSSFDTKNKTNMKRIINDFNNLADIDLSSFNTKI